MFSVAVLRANPPPGGAVCRTAFDKFPYAFFYRANILRKSGGAENRRRGSACSKAAAISKKKLIRNLNSKNKKWAGTSRPIACVIVGATVRLFSRRFRRRGLLGCRIARQFFVRILGLDQIQVVLNLGFRAGFVDPSLEGDRTQRVFNLDDTRHGS